MADNAAECATVIGNDVVIKGEITVEKGSYRVTAQGYTSRYHSAGVVQVEKWMEMIYFI